MDEQPIIRSIWLRCVTNNFVPPCWQLGIGLNITPREIILVYDIKRIKQMLLLFTGYSYGNAVVMTVPVKVVKVVLRLFSIMIMMTIMLMSNPFFGSSESIHDGLHLLSVLSIYR